MDAIIDDFEERVALARRYFSALSIAPGTEWRGAAENALVNRVAEPKTLALLHPQYLGYDKGLQVKLQGKPFFPAVDLEGLRGYGCLAVRIWGYKCDLLIGTDLNADHVFPWSLGGSTSSTNLLPLCRYHNQVKTNDVHLYPNWSDPPDWVWLGLERRLARVDTTLARGQAVTHRMSCASNTSPNRAFARSIEYFGRRGLPEVWAPWFITLRDPSSSAFRRPISSGM